MRPPASIFDFFSGGIFAKILHTLTLLAPGGLPGCRHKKIYTLLLMLLPGVGSRRSHTRKLPRRPSLTSQMYGTQLTPSKTTGAALTSSRSDRAAANLQSLQCRTLQRGVLDQHPEGVVVTRWRFQELNTFPVFEQLLKPELPLSKASQ